MVALSHKDQAKTGGRMPLWHLPIPLLQDGGTDGVHVTHLLYAGDLTLTANDPNAMQTMLNHLGHYARRKHLLINTAKSEVVHFNLSGSNLPVLSVGGEPLAHKESFKYLGMWFHKNMSMAKSSEHVTGPFMHLPIGFGSLCESMHWGTSRMYRSG
eukprot:41706-Pelagomonas_calceolata.AAC.1